MILCNICNRDITEVGDGDIRAEYTSQADYYGMESLTENQQLLVTGKLCEECFMELD